MAAQHTEAAQAELDLERRRTEAERRAFDSFRKRVSAIESSELQPDGGTQLVLSPRKLQRTSRPFPRDRVQRAYQDTVLSEPQCAEEYDESPREHMAAELGGDLLASVSEATTLTPQLKRALVDAIQRSRERRSRLLNRLDEEAKAIEAARAEMTAIATTLEDFDSRPTEDYSSNRLREMRDELRATEHQCEQITVERQRALHSTGRAGSDDPETTLQSYLYRDLDVDFPILSDVVRCIRLIRRARTHVERVLVGAV